MRHLAALISHQRCQNLTLSPFTPRSCSIDNASCGVMMPLGDACGPGALQRCVRMQHSCRLHSLRIKADYLVANGKHTLHTCRIGPPSTGQVDCNNNAVLRSPSSDAMDFWNLAGGLLVSSCPLTFVFPEISPKFEHGSLNPQRSELARPCRICWRPAIALGCCEGNGRTKAAGNAQTTISGFAVKGKRRQGKGRREKRKAAGENK